MRLAVSEGMLLELDAPMKRILATQVALDRAGFSPGEIDAHSSGDTDRALRAFQQAHDLPVTGELDRRTVDVLGEPFVQAVKTYSVTAQDLAGAAARESVEEMLAERFHTSAALLRFLNATSAFAEGDTIIVPNVDGNDTSVRVPREEPVVVTVAERAHMLNVQNASGTVIFHAPLTIASYRHSLPVGPRCLPPVNTLKDRGGIRLTSWDASRLASIVDGHETVIVR